MLCIKSSQYHIADYQFPLQTLQFSHLSIKPNHSSIIIMSSTNIPTGDVVDDDYKSRTGQSAIPVQSDGTAVEATEYDNGGDSEQQLGMLHTYLLYTLSLTQHREG
jgi:hypothetical protein